MRRTQGFNPRRAGGRTLVIIIAVVALILTVVVLAGHRSAGSPSGAGRPAAEPSSNVADNPAPDVSAAAGGLATTAASGAGAITVVLPADLAFSNVAGIQVPGSPTSGPRHTSGGLASGFTHDQAGAVLAAINIAFRSSPSTGPSVFLETIRDQVVGSAQQAFSVAASADYAAARGQEGIAYGQPLRPAAFVTIVGFRLDTYTGNGATISILERAPDSQGQPMYVAVLVEVSWVDGDWRMQAPPNGEWLSQFGVVAASGVSTYQQFAGS